MSKRLSPFSQEFWIKKGLSPEAADYKRNSFRPIRKEYWIERGFTEESAIEKALEAKRNNNKKGAKAAGARPKNVIKETSVRCIEYWLKQGYSEEEAKREVSRVQSTFSLEKCIHKYGIIEGTKRWKERQENWQQTLKSKSSNELNQINSKKNAISLKHFSTLKDCISELKKIRNMDLFIDVQEFLDHVLKRNASYQYWPFEAFKEKVISNIQKEIWESLDIEYESEIKRVLKDEIYLCAGRGYRKWVDEGLLRSSYEIYFYDQFKQKFKDKQLLIDQCYPDSSMRYDFYIDGHYVEIAPNYDKDSKYRQKMDKKKKLFGCILLKDIESINEFIRSL